MQQTLAIIKPDAIERNLIGLIIGLIEKNKLKIIEAKILKLTKQEAEIFYEVHKEKPFFNSLINYMTSNKIMALKIEGEDAVNKYRKLMGSTDPESADEGTIRKLYAESKERNSVHGSDSVENSDIEIKFFFE
ncbi:MAG: nucleoside-diphosphate kinase [Pseudomonadota bacterium]|nr:nucleoside-diphosphate kinase [Pseudomonadota bacterium]